MQKVLLSNGTLDQSVLPCAAVHGWEVHEDNKMDVSSAAKSSMVTLLDRPWPCSFLANWCCA